MWYCVKWWSAQWFESDSTIQMNVICFIWFQRIYLSSSMNCAISYFEGLVILASEENKVWSLQLVHMEYQLWHSDWLKLPDDWQPGTPSIQYLHFHNHSLSPFACLKWLTKSAFYQSTDTFHIFWTLWSWKFCSLTLYWQESATLFFLRDIDR